MFVAQNNNKMVFFHRAQAFNSNIAIDAIYHLFQLKLTIIIIIVIAIIINNILRMINSYIRLILLLNQSHVS